MKTGLNFLFVFLLLFIIASCSGTANNSSTLKDPVKIIYPEQGSTISNDWVTLVVSMDDSIFDSDVLIDGKRPLDISKKDLLRKKIYSVKVAPGVHKIEIIGTGRDIEKTREVYDKFSGNLSDLEELERRLKEIPVRQYRATLNLQVNRPGPLRLIPVRQSYYYSLMNYKSSFASIKPVAFTDRTLLVRKKRGLTEKYWIIPRTDSQRVDQVLESEPHFEITYKDEFVQTAMVQGCYGKRQGYAVVLDLGKENKLAFNFLDEYGGKSTFFIGLEDLLKRAFEKKIVPITWWKEQAYIMKWKVASVLPDSLRPMLCSENTLVVPVSFHCIYIKCSPSVLPGYLIVYKDGNYDLYISDKNTIQGHSWRGSEVVVPVGEKAIVLDLENTTYRILGQQKQYQLPLLVRLPERLSRKYYFQQNILRPESDTTMVLQQLSGSETNVYGLLEGIFSYRIVLKQTLIFISNSQQNSVVEEVPIYYAIEGTD
ncbi:MAG: hypothetical protein GXO99_04935 [Nitrospirae bacterium]|nr:hypothetical protein [Nitrospirota bacterium]